MPSHLIDVRTPEEYATGFLGGAVNIEYQNIASLASKPGVNKADSITLYCRSGRRSKIAEATLKEMGFAQVRDIGSLEEAREVLRREALERTQSASHTPHNGKEVDKDRLRKSTNTLLDGLRGLDD